MHCTRLLKQAHGRDNEVHHIHTKNQVKKMP